MANIETLVREFNAADTAVVENTIKKYRILRDTVNAIQNVRGIDCIEFKGELPEAENLVNGCMVGIECIKCTDGELYFKEGKDEEWGKANAWYDYEDRDIFAAIEKWLSDERAAQEKQGKLYRIRYAMEAFVTASDKEDAERIFENTDSAESGQFVEIEEIEEY